MIKDYKIDVSKKEFKSIFEKWAAEVEGGGAGRVSYPRYQAIRNFFKYGECKVCKVRSDTYTLTSRRPYAKVTSSRCGCTFEIPATRVTHLIEEYCVKTAAKEVKEEIFDKGIKKAREEVDRLSAMLYTPGRKTYRGVGAFSTPTSWDAASKRVEKNWGFPKELEQNWSLPKEIETNLNLLKEVETNKTVGGEENMNINRLAKSMDFGFVKGDKFKLSPLGLAFKNSENGYSVYDAKESEMTDVTGMTFEMDNAVMAMPTSIKKVVENDIIMHSNAYVVVKEVKENSLVVVSPFSSEVKEIIPVKNMFGFNFYTKLIPLFDMSGTKADEDNPFGSMMPMMLMSQMGGQTGNQMNPMMMMAMMNMGKKKDGENGDEDKGFMSKEMMMMMALSGTGNGANAGGNDMVSSMMMMSMFK